MTPGGKPSILDQPYSHTRGWELGPSQSDCGRKDGEPPVGFQDPIECGKRLRFGLNIDQD